ncbi:MAG TPA: SRPBCC family protein [Polyangiales bacterium]|nr:SRPBCC family protein [Polyangiales bacterium]
MYTLDRSQLVPRPLSEVFAFFANPSNLQELTPPFLGFRILTPAPIEMREGTLIDYRLSVRGIPLRWCTLIERFEPQRSFVDVQLRGPYRHWRHTHEFFEVNGGTEVRDRVEYALPLGPLGRVVHAAVVRRDVERIFDYRREVIAKRWPAR